MSELTGSRSLKGRTYMMARTLLAAAAALTLSAGAAQAALITSDATYTGPDLNLAGYDNGSFNFTFGPVTVGEFTFTRSNTQTNSGLGAVVGQGDYALNDNGNFGGDAVYIGLDGGGGYGYLTGATGYSQMGFFFNYARFGRTPVGDDPTIAALDINGNVLEEYNLLATAPIGTPGGFNAFAFRGISRSTADIYGFRFGGSYILATGTATGEVIPTVPPTGAVPEPGVWALMILGFGAAGGMLRRQRQMLAA